MNINDKGKRPLEQEDTNSQKKGKTIMGNNDLLQLNMIEIKMQNMLSILTVYNSVGPSINIPPTSEKIFANI